MRYDEKQYLLELGMRDKLLDYLTKEQLIKLAEFAMDNLKIPNLLQLLIGLASLERKGKEGAIELVARDIITTRHAKSLEAGQMQQILDIYHTPDHDEVENLKNARLLARQFIVLNQEHKSENEHLRIEHFGENRL